jgi:hypothetical protein
VHDALCQREGIDETRRAGDLGDAERKRIVDAASLALSPRRRVAASPRLLFGLSLTVFAARLYHPGLTVYRAGTIVPFPKVMKDGGRSCD